jgi:predicted lipid carrier protein YhbT
MLVNSPSSLSASDAQLLKWAKSKEGRLAQNLVEWNSDYLENRRCTQEVQDLGVELTVGDRVATSGYCVLWVVPPDQREFKEKQ